MWQHPWRLGKKIPCEENIAKLVYAELAKPRSKHPLDVDVAALVPVRVRDAVVVEVPELVAAAARDTQGAKHEKKIRKSRLSARAPPSLIRTERRHRAASGGACDDLQRARRRECGRIRRIKDERRQRRAERQRDGLPRRVSKGEPGCTSTAADERPVARLRQVR